MHSQVSQYLRMNQSLPINQIRLKVSLFLCLQNHQNHLFQESRSLQMRQLLLLQIQYYLSVKTRLVKRVGDCIWFTMPNAHLPCAQWVLWSHFLPKVLNCMATLDQYVYYVHDISSQYVLFYTHVNI